MTYPPSPIFSDDDHRYMRVAMDRAREALSAGNFPVGAALVIDGMCIDSEFNSNASESTWVAHAEHKLLLRNACRLRNAAQVERVETELFTTLEPCLMCLSAAVFSRIKRIVFALPDKNAGAASVDPTQLGDWYSRRWPALQMGLLQAESEGLIKICTPGHPRPDTYE